MLLHICQLAPQLSSFLRHTTSVVQVTIEAISTTNFHDLHDLRLTFSSFRIHHGSNVSCRHRGCSSTRPITNICGPNCVRSLSVLVTSYSFRCRIHPAVHHNVETRELDRRLFGFIKKVASKFLGREVELSEREVDGLVAREFEDVDTCVICPSFTNKS